MPHATPELDTYEVESSTNDGEELLARATPELDTNDVEEGTNDTKAADTNARVAARRTPCAEIYIYIYIYIYTYNSR